MKRFSLTGRIARVSAAAALLCALAAGTAGATPSTIVWIPSVDIQPFKTAHLTFDTYIRTSSETGAVPPVVDLGLTGGILPFKGIQAEAGFDLLYGGYNTGAGLDSHPLYFNGKIGTPEDSFFKWQPAVVAGVYGAGTKNDGTDANIIYGLAGKTFPVIGRLSAGAYTLNEDAAVATAAGPGGDDSGILLSWDRTLSEISDKLWVGVDYQGGDNAFGALSFGASWAFARNVSVIFGYDMYNETARGGEDTFTVQLDINFP